MSAAELSDDLSAKGSGQEESDDEAMESAVDEIDGSEADENEEEMEVTKEVESSLDESVGAGSQEEENVPENAVKISDGESEGSDHEGKENSIEKKVTEPVEKDENEIDGDEESEESEEEEEEEVKDTSEKKPKSKTDVNETIVLDDDDKEVESIDISDDESNASSTKEEVIKNHDDSNSSKSSAKLKKVEKEVMATEKKTQDSKEDSATEEKTGQWKMVNGSNEITKDVEEVKSKETKSIIKDEGEDEVEEKEVSEIKNGEKSDGNDEVMDLSIDSKSVKTSVTAQPIETRRRSLRNATKKVEVVTPVKTKSEKKSDSPRGPKSKMGKSGDKKDDKKGKVDEKNNQITPLKAKEKSPVKIEPMSDEILEKAKFPPFLKESITLGCYIPILDQNTGHVKLKEGESLLEAPSLSMPLLLKKPDIISKNITLKKDAPKDETIKKNVFQMKPYFTSSVGEFLIGIGLSRVTEWYEKDMMKVKQRQMKREGQSVQMEESLNEHKNFFTRARQANEPFNLEMKKCEFCDFKTESELVLQGHLLIPHLTNRREFRCNFCTFVSRDPKVIIFHMEALHNKKGILDLPGQFFYDCPFCTFETNLKTKATSHINKCQKYFLSTRNQTPPGDWENPAVTAKPITLADIKSYEMCVAAASAVARTANVKNMQQRTGAGRPVTTTRIIRPATPQYRTVTSQSNLSLYQQIVTASLKDAGHLGSQISKNRYPSPMNKGGKPEITLAVPGGQIYQVVNNGQMVPVLPGSLSNAGSQFMLAANQCAASGAPQPVALFPNLATCSSTSSTTISASRNSISLIPQSASAAAKRLPSSTTLMPTIVSPANLAKLQQQQQQSLPKLQGPYTTVQTASKSGNGNPMLANTTFVICEICDGYLKDLEQLRTHMLWIHKVKIHPKMLSSRPPLNCQKCQWRFFTDQGLERHLLGAHGLVTSNMQELANKNQDGGRCTVCGRVYVCKLVSHMNQVHKATLKPAHLSYKCTVCSATFNLYKLFENHVYMFHSGSVKRSANDEAGNSAKKKLQISKPSVELTVTPVKKAENPKETKVASVQRTSLPPPMKLPAVEPLPPPPPPAASSNLTEAPKTPNQLKKNFEIADAGVKSLIKIGQWSAKEMKDLPKVDCDDCGKSVRNLYMHMRVRHTRKCKVKLCRIEKCEKCLSSFDGMVVLHSSDFQQESEDEIIGQNNLPLSSN